MRDDPGCDGTLRLGGPVTGESLVLGRDTSLRGVQVVSRALDARRVSGAFGGCCLLGSICRTWFCLLTLKHFAFALKSSPPKEISGLILL